MLGPEHPHTITWVTDLATVLSAAGRMDEALDLKLEVITRMRKRAEAQPDRQMALALNNLAHEYRKLGDFAKAEPLTREALELDRTLLGADDPIIPHRLQNLAIVLLMRGAVEDACHELVEAWRLRAGRASLTGPRVLFLRLSAALFRNEPVGVFVGQLKTLLIIDVPAGGGGVSRIWDISYFVTFLGTKLAEGRPRELATTRAETSFSPKRALLGRLAERGAATRVSANVSVSLLAVHGCLTEHWSLLEDRVLPPGHPRVSHGRFLVVLIRFPRLLRGAKLGVPASQYRPGQFNSVLSGWFPPAPAWAGGEATSRQPSLLSQWFVR